MSGKPLFRVKPEFSYGDRDEVVDLSPHAHRLAIALAFLASLAVVAALAWAVAP